LHPVQFQAQFAQRRSRLTTFFRLILVIPHVIVVALWGIAALIVSIGAWFAILVTGRYPIGMWRFAAEWFAYSMRVAGYYSLLTDAYPPFGNAGPDYPIYVGVEYPQVSSRLKALFRIILVIPFYILSYVLTLLTSYIVLPISWLVIVFAGTLPGGLFNFISMSLRFQARTGAFYLLLTDAWPNFSEGQQPQPAGTPAYV
jgi:hypothetical protein